MENRQPVANRSLFTPRTLSIRVRMFMSFIAIVFLAISLVSAATTVYNFENQRTNALSSLKTINRFKEYQVSNWVNSLQVMIGSILTNQNVHQEMLNLLRPDLAASTESAPADVLLTYFDGLLQQTGQFKSIFLADSQGKVYLTTNPDDPEGAAIQQEWSFYRPGAAIAYVTPPYRSPVTKEITIIVAYPIATDSGEIVGLVGGVANIDSLNELMMQQTGLGITDQSYLIGMNREFITLPRMVGETFDSESAISTKAAEDIAAEVSSQGIYTGYRGNQILGVYTYVPSLQLGIVTEQDLVEVDQAVRLTIIVSIIVGVVALLIAAVFSLIIARSIARPIANLSSTVEKIAVGDLEIQAVVERDDEIGKLARVFNTMTEQLRTLITDLEKRVSERTQELENRAVQVETASEIARDLARTTNLNDLLTRAVNLITDRMNLYYSSIFLNDSLNEFAVLHAGTGEAGAEMLRRGHRLKIGEVGMVGYAISTGEARIALDVGEDEAQFRNPLLPETRSEIALPLRAGNRVIGALDVQSKAAAAFDQSSIKILQTMADQLAVAIDKAILFQSFEEKVSQLETVTKQYTEEAWREYLGGNKRSFGYRFRNSNIETYTNQSAEAMQAIQSGRLVIVKPAVAGNGHQSFTTLAVPFKLRDQVLGVIHLKFDGSSIPDDIIALIENAANRLALALDNARLLEEIRLRAESEHKISEITTRVRASNDIDAILRTAVTELSKALGVSEAVIQLRGDE